MSDELISREILASLEAHAMPRDVHVEVLASAEAVPIVRGIPSVVVGVHDTVESALRAVSAHPVSVVIAAASQCGPFVKAAAAAHVTVAVIGHQPAGSPSDAASLRASGVMDVVTECTLESLKPLLRRALDFRALLSLELAHRCEAKRLLHRERELLGAPPEQMSDDLDLCQPPPLPVGPMSVYNLDEASDAFERSYIDRVHQLCGSSREAAVHLGVSSATLSRRSKKEDEIRDAQG